MDTPISTEAVEAAARADAEARRGVTAKVNDTDRRGAERSLRAALPFLPQHVSPSVEDVARALFEHRIERVDDLGMTVCACGVTVDTLAVHQAEQVALLPGLTVEQVRREAVEQERLRAAERLSIVGAGDLHLAWAELLAYVSAAIDDGRGINAAEMHEYLRELKRRHVSDPIRAALRARAAEAGESDADNH